MKIIVIQIQKVQCGMKVNIQFVKKYAIILLIAF